MVVSRAVYESMDHGAEDRSSLDRRADSKCVASMLTLNVVLKCAEWGVPKALVKRLELRRTKCRGCPFLCAVWARKGQAGPRLRSSVSGSTSSRLSSAPLLCTEDTTHLVTERIIVRPIAQYYRGLLATLIHHTNPEVFVPRRNRVRSPSSKVY